MRLGSYKYIYLCLLFLLVSCESVIDVQSNRENKVALVATIQSNQVSSIQEDAEVIIAIEYSSQNGELATGCTVNQLTNVIESTACACPNGLCSFGLTGISNYSGLASFEYTVTTGDSISNSEIISLSIESVDDDPITSDLGPFSANEDWQSVLTLTYTDPDGDLATACSVSNLANITETIGCSCNGSGICTVGMTGLSNYVGTVSFEYNVTANGKTSANSFVNYNLNNIDDDPIANNMFPSNSYENLEVVHTLSYSDPDGDLATSCSISNELNVSVTTGCSCSGSGVCTVGVKGGLDYFGAVSFNFTVTANAKTSTVKSVSYTLDDILEGIGAGPDILSPKGIDLNSTATKAYVVNEENGELIEIDIATGLRVTKATGLIDPQNVQIGPSDTYAYISSYSGRDVTRVTLSNGTKLDVSNGLGSGVGDFYGMSINSAGTYGYVNDTDFRCYKKIEFSTGNRTIVSSDDVGTGTSIVSVGLDLVVDSTETFLYAAHSNGVLKINTTNGNRTSLYSGVPNGLTINAADSFIYLVRDTTLYRVNTTSGAATIVSSNSIGTGAQFSNPIDVALDEANSKAYVIDHGNASLYQVDMTNGNRTIISSSGKGNGRSLEGPKYVSMNDAGTKLYVSNFYGVGFIVEIDTSNGNRTVISESGVQGSGSNLNAASNIVINHSGTDLFVQRNIFTPKSVYKVLTSNGNRTEHSSNAIGTGATFSYITGIDINSTDDKYYIFEASTESIQEVLVSNGNRTYISGKGFGSGAVFSGSGDIVLDSLDNFAYVTDTTADEIFKVDLGTGARVRIAGVGAGSGYTITDPRSLAISSDDDNLYYLDSSRSAIVQVNLTTFVRTEIASSTKGSGIAINGSWVGGLTINPAGSKIYTTDFTRNAVIEIDVLTGNRTIFSR